MKHSQLIRDKAGEGYVDAAIAIIIIFAVITGIFSLFPIYTTYQTLNATSRQIAHVVEVCGQADEATIALTTGREGFIEPDNIAFDVVWHDPSTKTMIPRRWRKTASTPKSIAEIPLDATVLILRASGKLYKAEYGGLTGYVNKSTSSPFRPPACARWSSAALPSPCGKIPQGIPHAWISCSRERWWSTWAIPQTDIPGFSMRITSGSRSPSIGRHKSRYLDQALPSKRLRLNSGAFSLWQFSSRILTSPFNSCQRIKVPETLHP